MFRFAWSENSAVLWDRVTIDGVRLEAADPEKAGKSAPTQVSEIHDPTAPAPWPQTELDPPFVQLVRSTLETGMANLDGEKVVPWWPNPSFLGIPSKL